MISMMSAAFAMGPAWTLMRAISGYMSDEEVDRMMPFHDSDEKAHAAKNHRAEKQQETDAILETLDLFSGDNSFENELRAAIKEVTARYAGTRSERVPNGRRRRAASKIKSSINPEAKMDSKEVLEGLMYRADPFA
ncbi:hypothetical protein C725_2845 [Pacificimonas flava]|uniref:Uncharacterized protein n=2 Tax=Pacificimonas flava TaxID=1234595 RepID=M2U1C4_9SPHN|nr:hypothetical protein C725_2845 [Pacificimonas flava]